MIEKYKAARLQTVIKKTGRTLTPTTVNREIGCLKHMYSMAITWRYVKRNPVKEVKLLKQPPGRLRYLEPDEAERLLESCLEPYLKSIVVTALNTGMRKGEILSLTWNQVDLANRRITLMKTKNNELRVIPINDRLHAELAHLKTQPQKSEYVFCGDDGKPFGDIKKGWAGAVRRAGIADFRFHDLRHTVGSQLVMGGVDLRTVQQILGHKTIQMTQRYSHLSPAHVQDAMQKLGSVWSLYGHQASFTKPHKSHKSLKNKECARSSVG
jgi:integrase